MQRAPTLCGVWEKVLVASLTLACAIRGDRDSNPGPSGHKTLTEFVEGQTIIYFLPYAHLFSIRMQKTIIYLHKPKKCTSAVEMIPWICKTQQIAPTNLYL